MVAQTQKTLIMTTVIKRNDTLNDLLRCWNHNNSSNLGMGRFSRKINAEGIYVITKTYGRQDLAIFNISTVITVNGEPIRTKKTNQIYLEPYGISYNFKKQKEYIKLYILNWIKSNKEELCIQLHYLDWFNKVEIKNLTVEEVIKVLEEYKYNQEEAKILFNNLEY